MKNTLLFLCLFACHAVGSQTPAQVTVQDDAKVGLIVTGTGNTINTTQIFGKSPEYAELKKALATLEADIQKKAAVCEKMAKDNLPAEYRDGCRSELIALNARRDSVQKIEARFREDVTRLAETFSRIEINSERLRLAKKFFDEGKISEADNVLKEKDMAATGDAALAVKSRNDSVLLQTANEFALKAQLKALKMDYDSAQILFGQSRKYFETVDNLWAFAELLGKQNQTPRAIEYCEKALKLARSESEEALLAMNLGIFYSNIQKMAEAEKMYLHSLDIRERLAQSNPAQFEPDLARTAMNLGFFYYTNQKMSEAEKMYLRSLDINERLAQSNPAQFEPGLAQTAMNLGIFYKAVQKMSEAEKMYLRSLDIYERLAQSNPAQFEPDLEKTVECLANYFAAIQKVEDAERMYLRCFEISERLAQSNPAQFEPDLARTAMNLGNFYQAVQKMSEAEKMYLRSLDIYERLAQSNPAQFELDLAATAMNFGIFYKAVQKMSEAEKMYLRSLDIYERLVQSNPAQFDPDLARTAMNLGNFYQAVQKMSEAEKMYLRSLDIRERLAQSNPAQFEPGLALTALNLGIFYSDVQKMAEAEKMYLRSLDIRERLAQSNPTQFEPDLTRTLGNLSWFYLFVNKYPEAQAAASRALALDPAQNWVRTNLGHSHLLRNDWPQAKTIYEQYLKNEPDPAAAKRTLAKDWDDLEAAGLSSPAVEKARKWAKE